MYVKKKSMLWEIVLIVCIASVVFGCRNTAKNKDDFFEIRHNNELKAYGALIMDMPHDGPYDMRWYVLLPKYAIDNFDAFDIYTPKTEQSFTVKTDKLKYWEIGECGVCVVFFSYELLAIPDIYTSAFNEMGFISLERKKLWKITTADFCVSPQKPGKGCEYEDLYKNFAMLRETIQNDLPLEFRENFLMPKSSSKP